jgi:GNAT superfamily N-acetyltransferase
VTDVEIGLEGVAALDAFLEVVEEAAMWLWQRGIRQWEPGTNRAQRTWLARCVAHGGLVVARAGGELVGGCVATTLAVPAWNARREPPLYVAKLAVKRTHAGCGVATRILAAGEAHARATGHTRLRLDCWEGNARLRAYYRDAGFAELEAVAEHGYEVRLFERAL